MQRLVTIYLDNQTYVEGTWKVSSADKHGFVEEHLADELANGWRVISLSVSVVPLST
jgi:hypothetical protein